MTQGARGLGWAVAAVLAAGCHGYRDDLDLICHADPAHPSASALGERIRTKPARQLFAELAASANLSVWAEHLRDEAKAEGIFPCPLADALHLRTALVPVAQAAEPERITLEVTVDREGHLGLPGSAMKEPECLARVDEAIRKNPDTQVLVAADSRVVYDRVVRSIDVLKSHGVRRFALAVGIDGGAP
jgi:hypothetical protein